MAVNPVGGECQGGGSTPDPCSDDAAGCNPGGGGNLNTVVKADGGSLGTTYTTPMVKSRATLLDGLAAAQRQLSRCGCLPPRK